MTPETIRGAFYREKNKVEKAKRLAILTSELNKGGHRKKSPPVRQSGDRRRVIPEETEEILVSTLMVFAEHKNPLSKNELRRLIMERFVDNSKYVRGFRFGRGFGVFLQKYGLPGLFLYVLYCIIFSLIPFYKL